MAEHIVLHLKRLGKKKIQTVEFSVDRRPETLQALIETCVMAEVKRYNESREHPHFSGFLTPHEIQEASETGKIVFGTAENTEKATLEKAIHDAEQAFLDGLFAVLIDDREVNALSEKLSLQPESVITFIRLTFLTGTYWQI